MNTLTVPGKRRVIVCHTKSGAIANGEFAADAFKNLTSHPVYIAWLKEQVDVEMTQVVVI